MLVPMEPSPTCRRRSSRRRHVRDGDLPDEVRLPRRSRRPSSSVLLTAVFLVLALNACSAVVGDITDGESRPSRRRKRLGPARDRRLRACGIPVLLGFLLRHRGSSNWRSSPAIPAGPATSPSWLATPRPCRFSPLSSPCCRWSSVRLASVPAFDDRDPRIARAGHDPGARHRPGLLLPLADRPSPERRLDNVVGRFATGARPHRFGGGRDRLPDAFPRRRLRWSRSGCRGSTRTSTTRAGARSGPFEPPPHPRALLRLPGRTAQVRRRGHEPDDAHAPSVQPIRSPSAPTSWPPTNGSARLDAALLIVLVGMLLVVLLARQLERGFGSGRRWTNRDRSSFFEPRSVEIVDLEFGYAKASVIDDADLRPEGRSTACWGAREAGRRCFRLIAGLDASAADDLHRWGDLDGRGIPPERRPVGMVFQTSCSFEPDGSGQRDVRHGWCLASRASVPGGRTARSGRDLDLAARRPRTLWSAATVAIARSMARRPRVMLLDESFSSLDVETRQEVRGECKRVEGRRSRHDHGDARSFRGRGRGDRVPARCQASNPKELDGACCPGHERRRVRRAEAVRSSSSMVWSACRPWDRRTSSFGQNASRTTARDGISGRTTMTRPPRARSVTIQNCQSVHGMP